MESPFRSEAAAFRFLLISIVAAALIVVASWIHPWLGFAVFLALVALGTWAYMRMRGPAPPKEQVHPEGPPDERRGLVVADETVGGGGVMGGLREEPVAGEGGLQL